MANEQHVALLEQGVAAWNAWRDENPNIRPDLMRAVLGLADLRGRTSAGRSSGGEPKRGDLGEADLSRADLSEAALRGAVLREAKLRGANLIAATLVHTDLTGADLSGCRIHGVSAWGLKLKRTKQQILIITSEREPEITVDNIEVAQFIYLLLHNERVRDVIDTIGKKGVLLLGRFTEGRMVVLERLREKLRDLGFVPMVFNFDKPETKNFTDTVRLLCDLSHFVIVDITNPRSAPLELQATVPDYMVPFAPILQQGEEPFAMFVDLQNQYDWVLRPVVGYPSVDRLIEVLEDKVVRPAEAKFNELLARRTKQLRVEIRLRDLREPWNSGCSIAVGPSQRRGADAMGYSEAFRKHAEDCRQNARMAPNADARETWQRLADRWSRCAELEQEAVAAAESALRRRRERQAHRRSSSRYAA
jgi:hypothetical protein